MENCARKKRTFFFFAGLLPGLSAAFCLWAGNAPVFAQNDIAFESRVDRTTLGMNDTLTLQLIISGGNLNVSQPALPPIPGFRTYSSGQSQNFSFVNGRVSSRVIFTYALAPQSPGDYAIPSFSIQAGGKTLTTDPISIKVTSGTAPPPATVGRPSRGPRAAPRAGEPPPSRARDLFVTTAVDKKTAYVGELITLSFRFYSRAQLASQPAASPPDTTGFLVEDLPPQRQFTETLNGQLYSVVEMKTALFPASSGRFTIGPASLECRVQDFSMDPFSNADPFQNFFEDFFSSGKSVVLRSDPISIDVLPLPEEGRPASFKGDVGRFEISAKLDRSEAQVHEPVTLTVTVSGEGNIKSISAPSLPPLNGFKIYETLSSLNIVKTDYRVKGSKVFKTILKPDVSGKLEIPSVSFSYFDPPSKTYRTARTSSLVLSVRPAETSSEEGTAPAPPPTQEGVKVVGQDIRFIKSRSEIRPWKVPFHEKRAFGFLNLFPAAGFLALWGIKSRRARLSADPTGTAFRRAYRLAEKNCRRAQLHLKKENFPAYYENLQRTLLEYLGRKTRLSPQGLTWDRVEDELRRRPISDAVLKSTRQLWEDFDRIRFTPSLTNRKDAESHREQLTNVLKRLEAEWRS